MLDKLIGKSHTTYVRSIAMISHKFKHSTTESTINGAILKRDNVFMITGYFMEHIFINRF